MMKKWVFNYKEYSVFQSTLFLRPYYFGKFFFFLFVQHSLICDDHFWKPLARGSLCLLLLPPSCFPQVASALLVLVYYITCRLVRNSRINLSFKLLSWKQIGVQFLYSLYHL